MRTWSSTLGIPAPRSAAVLVDDRDAAAVEHDLQVAAPHGPLRPPALLHPPLLAHRLDGPAGDAVRQAVAADLHGGRPRHERPQGGDGATLGGTSGHGREADRSARHEAEAALGQPALAVDLDDAQRARVADRGPHLPRRGVEPRLTDRALLAEERVLAVA